MKEENQLFKGQSLQVSLLSDGIAELCFDRQGEAINKLDERTVDEFRQATQHLAAAAAAGTLSGVLLTSAKDVFIVGADITEFGRVFRGTVDAVAAGVLAKNQIFVAFEDLPVPSVAAINGFALGGGLELVLAASLRMMSEAAQVGVPEVKLGLFPGFGGTVRLSRVAGAQTAVDWVIDGRPRSAVEAAAAGVVDGVVPAGELRDAALALLRQAVAGEVDWRSAQSRKRGQVPGDVQSVFITAQAKLEPSSAHQPAALAAVRMMQAAASLDRAGALHLEAQAFAEVTQTQAAGAMVQTFLNDQAVKKLAKARVRVAQRVDQVAVLGAGVMGGGIAATNALRGTSVRLKDIAATALEAGLAEAARLVARQVKSGRLSQVQADAVLQRIRTQTDDSGFESVDLVIEAIVEKLEVKRSVLAALESTLRPGTVIASNTSSLRIADIAASLARPENLVGMHFFNPVPAMPLVEVVRGPQTGEEALATVVGHALTMGKVPIVVADVPGFLVNRIITPYVQAFVRLVAEGADFAAIDGVMEHFGWPMGPAYLQDVVGMDVGHHVGSVIAAGYPERMLPQNADVIGALVAAGRYGQKNGRGFYVYERDASGKPVKQADPAVRELLEPLQTKGSRQFEPGEIVERMMLPMVVEAALALEEGVVGTAAELDLALLLGLGFPPHVGGALKYADWLGLAHVVQRCDAYAHLGPAYHPTSRMREMAAVGATFHST